MGHALIRFAVVIVAGFIGAPAFAQAKPDRKDMTTIEKCLKVTTGRHRAWDQCIGTISEPCRKDEEKMTPSEVIACEDRERAVWDDILNKSFRILLKALDADQQVKLHEMQRAWIASRDKNCEFFYDFFQGLMANPMIAACLSRATGMQALYLRGFADDVADRK